MKEAYSKSKLLEVSIHASLWKTVLLAGADRRVTITVIGSCFVLILLTRFALWPCVAALLIATLGQLIGIKLANIDPQLVDIYPRHINFARAYLARTDIATTRSIGRISIPKV